MEAVFTVSGLMHEGFVSTHISRGSSETGSPNKKNHSFGLQDYKVIFLALSKYQFYWLTILGKFYKQV